MEVRAVKVPFPLQSTHMRKESWIAGAPAAAEAEAEAAAAAAAPVRPAC